MLILNLNRHRKQRYPGKRNGKGNGREGKQKTKRERKRREGREERRRRGWKGKGRNVKERSGKGSGRGRKRRRERRGDGEKRDEIVRYSSLHDRSIARIYYSTATRGHTSPIAISPAGTVGGQASYYRCDVILIMTSFATQLATPSVTDVRTDTLPRLVL